jgi:hypothetical protein
VRDVLCRAFDGADHLTGRELLLDNHERLSALFAGLDLDPDDGQPVDVGELVSSFRLGSGPGHRAPHPIQLEFVSGRRDVDGGELELGRGSDGRNQGG